MIMIPMFKVPTSPSSNTNNTNNYQSNPSQLTPSSPHHQQRNNDNLAALAITNNNTPRGNNDPSSIQVNSPSTPSPRNRSSSLSKVLSFARPKRAISSNTNETPSLREIKISNEERRKQLFIDFEMKKVVIYSNCKRLRALLEVLIERAKPHQVQNVSYILAQISVLNTSGLSPTTENDLKIVKQELNSINLDIFRLSLSISETYKQESSSEFEEDSFMEERLFSNVSCETVILKIIGRELSDMERELERMHRRCRANRKKPQTDEQATQKRSNSLFGRRRNVSAVERPSSMVIEQGEKENIPSLDFYRSPTMEVLGPKIMEDVKERIPTTQFRTVTRELHLENGIQYILHRRRNELIEKIKAAGNEIVDLYDPLPTLSTLKTEKYWRDFLEHQMGLTDCEHQRVLSGFMSKINEEQQ